MNNGKKEYPINRLEQDCTSFFGRKYLGYVNNFSGIKKFVKKQMNRRFRRKQKELIVEIMREDENDGIY